MSAIKKCVKSSQMRRRKVRLSHSKGFARVPFRRKLHIYKNEQVLEVNLTQDQLMAIAEFHQEEMKKYEGAIKSGDYKIVEA